MPMVEIAGKEVFYEAPREPDAGHGHVVLLIHGAFDNHALWHRMVPALAESHTPIAIDLPGHGGSAGPALDRAVDCRTFLGELVQALGLPRFVFCGHSMGGSMAVDFALHHPERLAGLVPVGSAPDWDIPASFIDGWDTDPDAVYRENLGYLFSKAAAPALIDAYDRQIRATPPGCCQADMKICDSFALAGRLGEIDMPTCVICGDEEFWIDGSRALHRGIAGASLDIVPAAGHALPLERPEALAEFMLRFLGGLPR